MADDDKVKIPRDEFSTRLRELEADDHAVRRDSTVDLIDWYGNLVTWRVITYRDSKGAETCFVQRQDTNGGARWVLPPEVMAAIVRHRAGATAVNRRRGARSAAATREARGIVPAFRKARK